MNSKMRLFASLLVFSLVQLSSSSFAATKSYDASKANGTPGDGILATTTLCPPVQTTLEEWEGHAILEDDGAGSVSLNNTSQLTRLTDLGPDQLAVALGPGAFIFVDQKETRTNVPPGGSVHVSAPGSGTDPGEAAVWGIVSGWSTSGGKFCVSSPIALCNTNNFAHGQTVAATLESGTYNLSTWAFDANGDFESVTPYLRAVLSGGIANGTVLQRGAFHGSSLPALPLVGFGALALSLAVIGGRSLMGKK
jgi:hypothetical protein